MQLGCIIPRRHIASIMIPLPALQFRRRNLRPKILPPVPIAERWFPKPEVLETNPGMHRFVWDLRWGSSGGPSMDEESEYRSPRGPKVVPGIYTVRSEERRV